VLGHDLEPNRFYAEVTWTARELSRIGPRLAGLRKTNEVAILYSVDSLNALEIMPITAEGHEPDFMPWMRRKSDYVALLHQVHRAFYDLNVEVDFVFPDAPGFGGYRLLVVPALYVADHALLLRIADFVKAGGHVLMTFKSGVADENSRVRHIRLPGPLREAAGMSYQEFSTLERPLPLKEDPFAIGADENYVMYWAEFLESENAEPLAYYDHPFFGRLAGGHAQSLWRRLAHVCRQLALAGASPQDRVRGPAIGRRRRGCPGPRAAEERRQQPR
jgi:beta-galactosidase